MGLFDFFCVDGVVYLLVFDCFDDVVMLLLL